MSKKTPAAKTASTHQGSPLNLVLIVISLGALGYMLYATFSALQPSEDSVAAVATPTPTPKLPELQLNQNHNRQGPAIVVNPDDIGKTNPFVAN